jgi:hypothetical protein
MMTIGHMPTCYRPFACYLKDGKKTKDLLGRKKLERKYHSSKQHLVYASRRNHLGHG